MTQVLAILVFLLVWGGGAQVTRPARAAEPTCVALAKLAESERDEVVRWGLQIADAVVRAEGRLAPVPSRPTLRVIDHPLEVSPGAWYCPSSDTVHVSHELVLWAWQGRASDGADFLAFVVAHELAHRRFDASGRASSALAQTHSLGSQGRACPTLEESSTESAADHRAVYLVGLARNPFDGRGFSPFNLTRRDGIRAFLAQELGWPNECPSLETRVDAVIAAVSRMQLLGELHETALLLAMAPTDHASGPRALGQTLLDRLGALTRGAGWDAAPEVDLMRAVHHLDRAQRFGWCPAFLGSAHLIPDPCTLRCAPPFPRFAGLSPYDAMGSRTSLGGTRAEEVAKARTLVANAKRAGLLPEHALGVEACLAFAEARPSEGLALFSRLERSRRAAWQPTVALLDLQRRLLESSDPALEFAGSGFIESPVPLRVPDAPLAGGPSLAHMRQATCGPWREHDLGEGWRLRISAQCRELTMPDGRGLELSERLVAGGLDAWRLACDVRGPGLADDGSTIHGARCPGQDGAPDDGWVLFERNGVLERVVRIRNI